MSSSRFTTSPHPAFEQAFALADEAATLAFGASLAPFIVQAGQHTGLTIWLDGNLGAGKTTTTRGLLRALGHEGAVKSPTYSLLEPYVVSRIALYHFDFYRFNNAEEFIDAGLEEYFPAPAICLVEWADKALPYVPAADWRIALSATGSGRQVTLTAHSERGVACLSL